jgi:hypothetical protein
MENVTPSKLSKDIQDLISHGSNSKKSVIYNRNGFGIKKSNPVTAANVSINYGHDTSPLARPN